MRRKKLVGMAIFSLVVFAIAGSGLYNFTGLLFKPPRSVNSGSSVGEWAMFRHDPRRTGAIDASGNPLEGKVKWVFPTGAPIHSSPAPADGTVYFGSRDFKFFYVEAASVQGVLSGDVGCVVVLRLVSISSE